MTILEVESAFDWVARVERTRQRTEGLDPTNFLEEDNTACDEEDKTACEAQHARQRQHLRAASPHSGRNSMLPHLILGGIAPSVQTSLQGQSCPVHAIPGASVILELRLSVPESLWSSVLSTLALFGYSEEHG